MADTYKILAQLFAENTSLSALYTVPGSCRGAVISTVNVANLTGSVVNFWVSIASSGEADAFKQYIYYDISIPGKDSFNFTGGATLGPNDVIRAKSDTGSALAFAVFGTEIY